MSTEKKEQQPTIEEMLEKLENDTLRRSHNSVKISITNMLDYVDKIRGVVDEADRNREEIGKDRYKHIKLLLKTYREMAAIYYTQFEHSLLAEIVKLHDLQTTSDETARAEYERLKRDFPTLMQNALYKLKDEWKRLHTIAIASSTLAEDENLLRTLEEVVEIAAISVGIADERIVIVPDRQFALHFFSYLDNLAVLTIPIYSVQSLWEYSIFWHELAGYQVKRLENGKIKIADTIGEIYNRYKISNNEVEMDKQINNLSIHDEYLKKYLKSAFSGESLKLEDLTSFEYHFDQMLATLPPDKIDKLKNEGWCVAWFKELFEDAFSVLYIGPKFLNYFKDILGRHNTLDVRHPPLEIRLEVAKKLLELTDKIDNIEFQSQLEKDDQEIIKCAAEQILKLFYLMQASTYQNLKIQMGDAYQKLEAQMSGISNETDGANQLTMVFWVLLVILIEEINRSIDDWLILIEKDDLDKVEILPSKYKSNKEIDEFLKAIERKNAPVPAYKTLLAGKDYKQLMEVSFFDTDYGFPFGRMGTVVTNVKCINTTTTYASVTLGQTLTCHDSGDVSFIDSYKNTKHTTVSDWNRAAPRNQQY